MNPYRYDIQTLERKARAVRRHIVRLNANSPAGGHTGADLSQVELLTALYFRVLNVAPDRLETRSAISTSSRKATPWAATTASWRKPASSRSSGWRPTSMPIPISPATRCGKKTPGIELNTGALGHGLPVAVGLALAAKKSNSTRRIFFDHRRRRTGGRQ